MENEALILTNFIEILNEYADKFKSLYIQRVEGDGRVATGALIQNCSTYIKGGGTEYSVMFQVADYYRYIEEGRKAGKFPPIDKILKWIQVKPVLPHPDSNGKLPTEKQLAFLIGRAIAENGTIKDKGYDGGHYVAKTTQELNDIYLPKLQKALEEDFGEYSIKIWKGINKMLTVQNETKVI